MDFSVYDHNSSEDSGEPSRLRNNNVDAMKTLRINERASPVPVRRNQINKSKSGHSIKGLEL